MSVRKMCVFALSCAMLFACGCNNKPRLRGPRTAGEIAKTEGRLKLEQGEMMIEGEEMVARGAAQKARGQALVEQGRRITGERQVRKGELLIQEGEALIQQGRDMNTDLTDAGGLRRDPPQNMGSEPQSVDPTGVRPSTAAGGEARPGGNR